MIYQYLPVERIHYGFHVVRDGLLSEITALNKSKILLVTTNSMLGTKAYKDLVESLQKNGLELFQICSRQHVPGNIIMKDIDKIQKFNPDLIISCGGGSPIDAAKILSFVLAAGIQREEDLYPYSENKKEKPLTLNECIPHIAIPTTLSASEFTSIAGATNSVDSIKYKFSHLKLTPTFVFLDPIFTLETPDWLFISTGMRAVDHAVETLYSPTPNPINTGLALQALQKLYYNLPLSRKNKDNLQFRLECQVGAWLSLFSVVNIKLGLSHSIGHQLGALYDIPHGMTSAIMLPHVMDYLLPRTYEAQAEIPKILGKINADKESVFESAKKAPAIIKGLIQELEIPHRLRDFQVSKDTIPLVVKNILTDISGEGNQFVLGTEDIENDITRLVEAAW
ncbi:iron-containing alcohol dehydrogenase [Bacillus dakarensis]|uniref:iron-containing alcohol dehydrogenase n=1 Tax=Robertmurraya dakarensis TaxID=1926278 RepID=UPI000980D1CB|nr:iron-containing alcohol dehydrogenase [Bacillus dakarensis]